MGRREAVGPKMTGIASLIIPAFSFAISSIVSPNMCVWSFEIEVMIDKIGETTLVASSLPPSPTSIMAKSTSSSLKYKKAKRVITSKKVGVIPLFL